MNPPLLSVTNLTVDLPGHGSRRHAVQDVSFDIRRGETLCLVGESGSGKSVAAHSILGLLPRALTMTSGTIMWRGRDIAHLRDRDMRPLRGREIAMVFQEPGTALNPLATAGAQLHEAIAMHAPHKATPEAVAQALEAVGLTDPERIMRAYPFELSGGQRQRVAIAMALANSPDLIIADEPTTALDVTTQARILDLFKMTERAQDRPAVLFITHDLGVVAEIADRVAVMKEGRIVESGPVSDVLERPQHPYTQALCSAVFAPPHAPRGAAGRDGTILQLAGVAKTYRKRGDLARKSASVAALQPLSLGIARGECLAVVGESGSGKSTLARLVTGLDTASEGAITLMPQGAPRVRITRPADCARHVQMVFQDPANSLNPRMPIRDTITRGARAQGMGRREAQERAAEMMHAVGLEPAMLARFPAEFSGGQRQRIAIARALMPAPQVLVADEAISALDVLVQVQVLGLLDRLRHQFGLTLIFITHDLRAAAAIADKVLVMQTGQVVEYGAAKQVFEAPAHPYTQTLLKAAPGRGRRP